MAGDTGNGATLVLATTGAVGDIQSMTLPEWTLDAIEDSHLGTTNFKTFIASDLADPGQLTATIVSSSTVAFAAPTGVAETVTVTWPIGTSGNTVAATFIGTGFITSKKLPDLANGALQVRTLTVKYNGQTEPAYTVEAA